MKKLIVTLLLATGMVASTWTLDLHTDVACNDLKMAIQQGRSVEQVKAQFEGILVSVQLSTTEQADLAAQGITYAKEQKRLVQMALGILGNKPYDKSKIAWGVGLSVASACCMKIVYSATKIFLQERSQDFDVEDSIAGMSADALPFSDKIWQKYLGVDFNDPLQGQRLKQLRLLGITEFVLYAILGTYLLYKGVSSLHQGCNQKKLLEAKIVNFDETINYFQKLAPDQEQNSTGLNQETMQNDDAQNILVNIK